MKNNYFTKYSKILILASFAVIIGLIAGCSEKEDSVVLWDTSYVPGAAPVITSVSSLNSYFKGSDSTFAVIDSIEIIGSNFLADPAKNLVNFDDVRAVVLSATPTRLVVKAPNYIKDSIKLKVSVYKVLNFSNTVKYNLKASNSIVSQFTSGFTPWAITADKDGNVYYSLSDNIRKVTAKGDTSTYVPSGTTSSVKYWLGLKVGPNGDLYGSKGLAGIWKIAPGVVPPTAPSFVILTPATTKIIDFDFDAAGNIWACGNTVSIYRVTADKKIKTFPFVASIKSVRVFQDYVYLGGTKDNNQGVWRAKIVSSDSLATPELYFDFKASGIAGSITAITFTSEGNLVIGTDGHEALVFVKPDNTWSAPYETIINPDAKNKVFSFVWAPNGFIYYSRQILDYTDAKSPAEAVVKLNMLKTGAPYYGLK